MSDESAPAPEADGSDSDSDRNGDGASDSASASAGDTAGDSANASTSASAPKPRPPSAIAACLLAVVVLLAADLWTKRWAETALSTERLGDRPAVCEADENGSYRYQRLRRVPQVVIDDVFELEYAENCGAAFGLLRTAPAAVRGAIF